MNRFSQNSNRAVAAASENINILDSRQANLFECRIALLRELVDSAMTDTDSELSYLEKLKEAYSCAAPKNLTAVDMRESYEPETVKRFFNSMSVIEKLEICRKLADTTADLSHLLLYEGYHSQQEVPSPVARGRIAYMKNNFTESAFLCFSKVIANPRSAYFQSFDAVCEEVYSGGCEFCILPIESSSEGRLNSFYSMIDRFELKISAVCVVDQHDGQKFTKFALLKKSLSDSLLKHGSTSEHILEFKISSDIGESVSLSSSEKSPICDIITAAEASGMRLLRIDSMPLPYSDEMMAYYVSLSIDRSRLIPFLLYLTLEYPQYDPLGLYFTAN